jgi:hypothetical protein
MWLEHSVAEARKREKWKRFKRFERFKTTERSVSELGAVGSQNPSWKNDSRRQNYIY